MRTIIIKIAFKTEKDFMALKIIIPNKIFYIIYKKNEVRALPEK